MNVGDRVKMIAYAFYTGEGEWEFDTDIKDVWTDHEVEGTIVALDTRMTPFSTKHTKNNRSFIVEFDKPIGRVIKVPGARVPDQPYKFTDWMLFEQELALAK